VMFQDSWNSPAIILSSSSSATRFMKRRKRNATKKAACSVTSPISCRSEPDNTSPNATIAFVGRDQIQCPMCLRFLSVQNFGKCIGVPTAEFPLLEPQTRKRKRTETRNAHETILAPCNECLDSLGETEGTTWGRCDNPRCWSRGGESYGSTRCATEMNTSGEYSANQNQNQCSTVAQATTAFDMFKDHRPGSVGIGAAPVSLVCPKCTPEGGLGCSHKWICDICAFWDKHPLVWECPGCLNDYCNECDGELDWEEERCVECGKRGLCGACRNGSSSPTNTSSSDSSSDLRSEELSRRVFSWRCRLCSLPVCGGCVPLACMNRGINSCRNCHSDLCGACRSVLACQQCGGEMCQLCLGESLVMLCDKCEHRC